MTLDPWSDDPCFLLNVITSVVVDFGESHAYMLFGAGVVLYCLCVHPYSSCVCMHACVHEGLCKYVFVSLPLCSACIFDKGQ